MVEKYSNSKSEWIKISSSDDRRLFKHAITVVLSERTSPHRIRKNYVRFTNEEINTLIIGIENDTLYVNHGMVKFRIENISKEKNKDYLKIVEIVNQYKD